MSAAVMEFADVEDAHLWASALRDGACRAWALSPLEFARVARRRVQLVLSELGLTGGLADDLVQGVGELAVNAVRHGETVENVVFDVRGEPVAGLPELWLHVRRAGRRYELVVTVFDTGKGVDTVYVPELGRTDAVGETGRGFQIVDALAAEGGGHWGVHPSRSRLGRWRVPGTAAWLALPLPYFPRPLRRLPGPTPAEAVDQLAAHLTTRGVQDLITRVYGAAALLSCPGLIVWANNGAYWWTGTTGRRQRPFCGLVDVAEAVLAEVELATRRRRQQEKEDRC